MLARIGIVLVALLTAGSSLLRDVAVADDGQADLLLVLAADVSYSIDAKKFALQRQGYAAAISDPRVIKAMTGGTHRRIGSTSMPPSMKLSPYLRTAAAAGRTAGVTLPLSAFDAALPIR